MKYAPSSSTKIKSQFSNTEQWQIQELTDGRRKFLKEFIHTEVGIYMLLGGFGGMLLRQILKSKASNDAF